MSNLDSVLLVHGVGDNLPSDVDYAGLLGIEKSDLQLHNWAETLDSSWLDGTKRRKFFRWNPLRKLFKLDLWGDRIDDAPSYFLDKRTRQKCIDLLAVKLLTNPSIDTIVGHSLGSVLVWQTLHTQKLGKTYNLVLIGSPLAMRAVRFKLWWDGCRGNPPACKVAIISGGKDPVACHGRNWNKVWGGTYYPTLTHDLHPYLLKAGKQLTNWKYERGNNHEAK